MRVLVTGAKGMLGSALVRRLGGAHEVIAVTRNEFDIIKELDVRDFVADAKPDWVVHCAAFTNVDGCEKEPDKAFNVNALGAKNVALACWGAGARLAHVSTDYVYDGAKGEPYSETDPVNPLGVYGKSKLKGEQEILKVLPDALIVRTSWLYGKGGPNFVEAILTQAGIRKELSVVSDQAGSPTYTPDLADGIVRLAEAGAAGIVHVSNDGHCSWFDYARKILELSGIRGVEVRPISTLELGRPAPRPAFSVLSNMKYQEITGHSLRHWEAALKEYLEKREEQG